MSRRGGGAEGGEQRSERDYTFGHALLTVENIQKLADQANYWAVILKFENSEEVPNHGLFPKAGLLSLFDQGRLCRATLLAGFKTTRSPKRPVPACFFRTLDFLLQYVAAGSSYRAITDKEEAKGFPPAAWCRPPMVSAREDAETMTAAALAGATPAALERVPATDPIRLFFSCRSWCFIHSFSITAVSARLTIGVPSEQVYGMYCDGALSEYMLMLGLAEEAPPQNTWAPPCVLVPLGALLYMHGHGRPYLPLTLSELRDVRSNGIMAIAVRPDARPMRLPAGVWPPATEPPARPVDLDHYPAPAAAPPGQGRGGGGGAAGGRHPARVEPTAAAVADAGASRQVSGASASVGARGAAAEGSASSRQLPAPRAGAASNGPGDASNGSGDAAAVPARPAEPEPDPILNSSNWIMPQPFDTPIPPPPPESADVPATYVADADAVVAANGSQADGDGAAAVAASAAAAAAALPPSPFLQYNDGVQPSYETPALRLFLGERGQSGLTGNWWYVDSETNSIKGPYSPEAMLLSCITPCREMHDETLVCGTEADVRLPMLPPTAAFLPLGDLLRDVVPGSYALVSRAEIVSPLARSFLGNRIRQPKPARPAAPSPTPMPVVIAVQATQPQPSQPQPSQQPQQLPPPPPPPPPQQQQQPQPQPQPLHPQPQLQVPQPAQQHTAYPVLQAPLQPQPQPAQPQPQPLQQPPLFGAIGAAHTAMRGLPLPHLMAGGARPRPMAAGGGLPVPAYTLPGAMVYMPQYGQAAPYGGQVVMAHPVLANAQMQQTAPQLMGQPQQHQQQ